MENPPDPRPVFEADQVLTYHDILGVRNGYYWQFTQTSWFHFLRRFKFMIGVSVCNEMLHWLAHGKPPNGVDCRGGH